MYYLNNLFKVFYIGLVVLLLFIMLASIFDMHVGNIIFINYLIVILPILERIFNYILKDFSVLDVGLLGIKNKLKYLSLIFVGAMLFFFFNIALINLFIILFLFFSLLFILDSRISFFIGLFLLSFIPILLIIDNNIIAEKISIYSYYFLIIGVLISIVENYFNIKSAKDV